MKKLFTSILAVVMVLSLAVPAAAQGEPEWSGVNVSPVNPMEQLVPFGTSYPSTSYYPHGKDPLPIGGSAKTSTLWLSNMVLGCDKYYIEITNNINTPLKLAICRQKSGDLQYTVYKGSPLKVSVTADPNEIVCMQFNAPSDFEGFIQCDCDE